MAAGEEFAADFGKRSEAAAGEVGKVDGTFVVVELADQELTRADVSPAEKRIRLQLHGALTGSYALAIVVAWMRILHIGRVDGWRFFFNLQEERVIRTVAFEVDAVVAQTDRPGADDFECDVNRAVEGE